ncbi:MAG: DNRLRE domain-containing protein, partial [Phaeodactylibacter sp.]|nr:DNRLRE domain-containing protein [Phaeodactylibacter sp.]
MLIRYLVSAVFFCLLSLSPMWGQTVSKYGQADAVVMEAYPDSIIDQSNVGNNILAYRHREGDDLFAVYSYVKFDISNLNGTQIESASFSYRGKTGNAEFEELFELELHSLKSDFDAENLSWATKPQKDKKLATSALNGDSGRKSFINDGTKFVDYINEAARKGETTLGFLVRSAAKDTTSNMWIGGIGNGNYGPILEYTISPEKSGYAHSDAVVMQAFPDSIIDQSNIGGNVLAYRHDVDGELMRVESYVKYDIGHLAGQQVETVSLSYRGKTGAADFEDQFIVELHSIKSDFDAENLTWNTKPQKDKKLATTALSGSSAREAFINEGTNFADYINEELRKGNTTIGILLRSTAKDSTSNMWIGGVDNGSWGPVLD